jgi:hypothetical protein
MIQKSKFLCVTVVVFLCLVTLFTFSFAKKDSKATLDSMVMVTPELRVVETYDDARAITDDYFSKSAVSRFLLENGGGWYATIDLRRGVPSLIDGGAIPFLPGVMNSLRWNDFGANCESINCIPKEKVEELSREFLDKYPGLFPVTQDHLIADPDGTIPIGESFYLVRFQWVVDGIPVENGSIFFRINNGNLISIASVNIAPIKIDTIPSLSPETAIEVLNGYLGGDGINSKDEILDKGSLWIIPVTPKGMDANTYNGQIGTMYDYKLAYKVKFRRAGVMGTWEGVIDAHTGELIRFVDSNRYGKIQGGVYKTDKNPTQTEVTMPFPYADYGASSFADIGGNFPGTTGTSTMTGRTGSAGNVGSVDIVDTCGSISLASDGTGLIDFGSSSGTDCTTPGFGGAGNTHASRTQYYNVSWIKIKAYTYLSGNSWLQGVLTDNVNLNQTCNAYWNGTSVNFFHKGTGQCGNTGEIPGVSLHEWGHGMDDNDGSGGDSPPVETRADWTAILQTHQSCAGGGFFDTWNLGCGQPSGGSGYNCDGYGDCCLDCSGIREADWDKHSSHTPWTIANYGTIWSGCDSGYYYGPCGKEDHCESGISTQALWDLAVRDLPNYCSMDTTSAWQLIDRLFYSSMPQMGDMYTCTPPSSNGCGGTSLFNLFRSFDDSGDGTANGTPHAQGIFQAFNRHLIACGAAGDQSNQNQTSCPTLSTPSLTGVGGSNSAILNWGSVSNATRYFIFRNDTSCDSGFTKIATVNSPTTTYTDNTGTNGITSYYRIQAATASDACVSAMSNCVAVTPQPCAGAVTLSKSVFNCNDTGTITVLDSTAPTSPFNVEIWSTTDSTHRNVSISGTPSTYTGTFTTTTGTPGANQVKVSNGDTIYVRYVDPDYCGTPNVNVDTNASVDCVGPIISNVQSSVAGVTATITWDTDELSNSKVYYGMTPPTWSQGSDAVLVTSHSIVIPNLPTCTKFYFYVESIDSAGNTSSDNNGGSYYIFVTGLLVNLVDENFEGTWGPYGDNPPTGWTIEDHGSAPGTWNANDWYNYAKGGAYGAVARVYYSPVEDQDEWLITPAFDISSDLTSVNLEYDHYFRVYSSGEYGYVDYKSDQHSTWVNLSTYSATTADMAHVVTPLTSYIGDTNAQIRFRYVSNNGWNWDVDNVLVQASGVCASSMGSISLDDTVYTCNSDTITITIRDTDLSGSAQATVTTTGGDSEIVTCNETGVGVFTGTILTGGLPRVTGNGVVNVTNGETITATYYDANDGSGNPATVQDTAITDCVGPVISNVLVTNITGTSATITWTTDENSNSRVTYGTSIPPSTNQDDLTNYTTSHTINLIGLTPCTPYYFSVTSSDSFGNSTTDTNGGSYYNFTTPNTDRAIFSEDFSTVSVGSLPAGWTESHSSGNAWSTSSSGCTNNALYYPYTYSSAANSWVYTPAIALTSGVTYTLHFNQKVASSYYPEKFEVTCGSSATPSGQTITVLPSATYTNTTCQPLAPTFSVPTSGNYYIAWHCTSDAGMDYLYIDDVNLTKPGSCTPELEYLSHIMTDDCGSGGPGDGNNILEPGEDAVIQITMKNVGGAATGVSATLSCSTSGITVTNGNASFPDIGANSTGTSLSPHFSIHVASWVTCVTTANFTLHSTSNENPTGTDSYFTINIGQAGGEAEIFSETFDGVTPPALPGGWAVIDTSGTAGDWATNAGTRYPSGGGTNTPPNVAYFNSYSASNGNATRLYMTSGFAIPSGFSSCTLSFYMYHDSGYSTNNDTVQPQISTNGGSSWTNLGSPIPRYSSTSGWVKHTISLNSYIGQSDVRLAFLGTSAYGNDCHIDTVKVTYPTPPTCNTCYVNEPNIVYQSQGTFTEITGDGDANYERGEKWSVQVNLTNSGTSNATNVTATLTGNGITVCTPTKSFGDIAIGGTGSATFEFVIDTDFSPCGGTINFNITNKGCTEKTPAGADESNVFNITVGQLSGGGTVTLFGPDDTPGTSGLWTLNGYSSSTVGTCTGHSTAAIRSNNSAGTYYATLTNPISTVGYINIKVGMDWRVTATTSTEYLDWSTNGTTWNTATSTTSITMLCDQSFTLPSGAENQSTLYIRFRNVATAASRGIVDYISITGDVPISYNCSYVGSGSCGGCVNPSVPSITNITDNDACAQSGITITFTSGSPATRHDLYRDSTLVQSNVTSPISYNPGDSNSHSYVIRAINGADDCYTDSSAVQFTDANGTPSQPIITSIVDIDPNELTGIQVNYTSGTPATRHDLYKDGSLAVSSYVSGATYQPGDSSTHSYVVKAINGTCTTDSAAVNGTDAYSVIAPPEPDPVTPTTDKNTLSWSASTGATGYRVYRGTKDNLAALCDATADFCTAQDSASTSYSLTGDTPADTYKCFYYLVTAYNAGGESAAGTATCGTRVVNTTGTCP